MANDSRIIGNWATVNSTIAKSGTDGSYATIPVNAAQILVKVPTIDSATITIQFSDDSGTTDYNIFRQDGNEGDPEALVFAASTGLYIMDITRHVLGMTALRAVAGAAQTTAAVNVEFWYR